MLKLLQQPVIQEVADNFLTSHLTYNNFYLSYYSPYSKRKNIFSTDLYLKNGEGPNYVLLLK